MKIYFNTETNQIIVVDDKTAFTFFKYQSETVEQALYDRAIDEERRQAPNTKCTLIEGKLTKEPKPPEIIEKPTDTIGPDLTTGEPEVTN